MFDVGRDEGLKRCLRAGVTYFTLPPSIPVYDAKMRGLVIAALTLLAVSTMVRGHPHFVPRPTAPIPAVNVP